MFEEKTIEYKWGFHLLEWSSEASISFMAHNENTQRMRKTQISEIILEAIIVWFMYSRYLNL